jgi:hypothetical protein
MGAFKANLAEFLVESLEPLMYIYEQRSPLKRFEGGIC